MSDTISPNIAAAVAPGKDLDPSTLPSSPIAVSAGTSAPAALKAAVRYGLSIAIPYAVGKGWIGKDDAVQVSGIVLSLIPAAWGIYSAIKSHNIKAALEPFAPAEVAVRK